MCLGSGGVGADRYRLVSALSLGNSCSNLLELVAPWALVAGEGIGSARSFNISPRVTRSWF